MSNGLEKRYTQVAETFADECSRRLAPVKSWVSSRFGVPSACHSSQTCRRRIPYRWQPPCRPPCKAVQRHRVRRARLPKVMARAAAELCGCRESVAFFFLMPHVPGGVHLPYPRHTDSERRSESALGARTAKVSKPVSPGHETSMETSQARNGSTALALAAAKRDSERGCRFPIRP